MVKYVVLGAACSFFCPNCQQLSGSVFSIGMFLYKFDFSNWPVNFFVCLYSTKHIEWYTDTVVILQNTKLLYVTVGERGRFGKQLLESCIPY